MTDFLHRLHWSSILGFMRHFGFLLAGWISIYVARWRKRHREAAAQNWPLTQARVWSAEAKPIPHTTRYMAEITYSYYAIEYRTGVYRHEFRNHADAGEFAGMMRGKEFTVRYNPEKPEVSVLEQSTVDQIVALRPRFG